MSESVYNVACARRTVHFYDPERQLPDGLLERSLEAAVRAPNHKLTNPWRFTVVGSETRSTLTDIAVDLKAQKPNFTPALEEKVRQKVGSSPELVVVSQVIDSDDFRRREDYAACACAIQNMCLVLWEEGVGSKWSSGGVTRDPRSYAALGIDPEVEEIIAFVWIGYPDKVPDPPRKPVEEVVRRVP
jgi:nitroreductase